MFTRTTGLLIVPLWMASMGWLVHHDVWPQWVADDPPVLEVTDWLRAEGRDSQFVISDDEGPIGSIWTRYVIQEKQIQREDTVFLHRLPLELAPLRIRITAIFTVDGELDSFGVRMDNPSTRMELIGERFHADFSFTFTSGGIMRAFKMPLHKGRMISGGFRPFAELNGLALGQRWRMQVFNPIAAITGFGDRFIPMLVEVTREENVDTGVWSGKCLVVESEYAKAWVDDKGVVQMQEVELPALARLRIVRQEDFDTSALGKVNRLPYSWLRTSKR